MKWRTLIGQAALVAAVAAGFPAAVQAGDTERPDRPREQARDFDREHRETKREQPEAVWSAERREMARECQAEVWAQTAEIERRLTERRLELRRLALAPEPPKDKIHALAMEIGELEGRKAMTEAEGLIQSGRGLFPQKQARKIERIDTPGRDRELKERRIEKRIAKPGKVLREGARPMETEKRTEARVERREGEVKEKDGALRQGDPEKRDKPIRDDGERRKEPERESRER